MAKPRIIIADTDESYLIPLQLKFAQEFFEKIDLEIITDAAYFAQLFQLPQRAEVLIVSEDLYTAAVQKHNISHIFVMDEQYEEERTGDLNVNHIFKYTSIQEIFHEILGKSAATLQLNESAKQETKVILFYSASGGAGKTTAAVGVSAALAKNYKKVLYINAARLQVFQHMIKNQAPITASDVYAKLSAPTPHLYTEIKHVVRKELFSYVPPFKAALMSLGLSYTVYEAVIRSAQKSGEYDYILVDADVTFDEEKASLLNLADKVVILMRQEPASVLATNLLVSNMNGVDSEKYIFICNDFVKDENSALIAANGAMKFSISEYIRHFEHYETMSADDLSRESSIQKAAFLIL